MSTRSDSYPGHLGQLPSGSWRWRVSIAGQRHAYTWSDVDEEEAARKAREKYNELSDRVERGAPGETPLSRFLSRFEREEVPKLADSSQDSYRATLKALRTYFVERGRDPKLRQLGRGHVKRFLSWRRMHWADGRDRSEPLSDYTVRTGYAIFRRILSDARDLELIDVNPADQVDAPKVEEREPVLLSDAQLEKLLDASGEDDMLRLYVLILAETGLRSHSEAPHVRWDDVDLEEGFLFVPSGRDGHRTKSGKGRYVPLTARLRAALRDHAATYRMRLYDGERSPYVLHHVTNGRWGSAGDRRKSFKSAINRAADRAGLPETWRPHDLRHRRCTRWLAEGHSPALVRKAMGHADLSTTLQYEHLVKRDLRSMVEESEKEALAELGT